MLSKTIIAAAAVATSVAAYDLPSCWTTCFEKYEVDSEGCLCTDKLGDVVGSCISSGCNAANGTAYTAWLASYCNEAPVSSNTWAVPSSTYAIPSSYASPSTSSSTTCTETSTTETWTSATTTASASTSSGAWGYASETYPSSPVTYASSTASGFTSVCTESTTMIWRSTTAVVPVTITHLPGGGWTTAPVYPAGNATATGTWASGSYSGPIATGAAAPFAKVGAGVAALVGGAAAVLL